MSIPANNLKPTNLDSYRRKAPSTDWKTTKTIRFKPLPKSDLSPTSYKPDLANKIVRPKALAYSTGKEKLNTYITRHTSSKAFVPSPSAYNPDKADTFITIGARKSYR